MRGGGDPHSRLLHFTVTRGKDMERLQGIIESAWDERTKLTPAAAHTELVATRDSIRIDPE